MSESLVLTFLAGIFGIVLGVGVLAIVSQILAANPSDKMPLSNPQISFGIAIVILQWCISIKHWFNDVKGENKKNKNDEKAYN